MADLQEQIGLIAGSRGRGGRLLGATCGIIEKNMGGRLVGHGRLIRYSINKNRNRDYKNKYMQRRYKSQSEKGGGKRKEKEIKDRFSYKSVLQFCNLQSPPWSQKAGLATVSKGVFT